MAQIDCIISTRTPGEKYPKIWDPKTEKYWLEHRLAYTKAKGPIPSKMFVCHSCDTPRCVNPNHLFLGTHQDNMTDKVLKNRQYKPKGIKNTNAKLTDADVLEIKKLKGTRTQQSIADDYGVNQSIISDILRNKTWQHLNK